MLGECERAMKQSAPGDTAGPALLVTVRKQDTFPESIQRKPALFDLCQIILSRSRYASFVNNELTKSRSMRPAQRA